MWQNGGDSADIRIAVGEVTSTPSLTLPSIRVVDTVSIEINQPQHLQPFRSGGTPTSRVQKACAR